MNRLILGISASTAGAGKDTFFKILKNTLKQYGIPVTRFALADALKNEVNPFLKKLYSVDINKCSPEEKELVRPLLISHGHVRRRQSNGSYFFKILDKEIKKIKEGVICITDIRYKEYEYDEVDWVKSLGKLIYIKPYTISGAVCSVLNQWEKRVYLESHVKEEREMGPILERKADYIFEWQHKKLGTIEAIEDIDNIAAVSRFILDTGLIKKVKIN